MKRGRLLSLCFIIPLVLLGSLSFADDVTVNLVSQVLESFNGPEYDWIVTGSKFVTQGYPQFKIIKGSPEALREDTPKDQRQIFGIHAKFDRKGYNYLEIIPVKKGEAGSENPTPEPIPIPGRAQQLDLWVWGSNYNFNLEAHFLDYRGIAHVVPFGSLRYTGWKNLKVNIPKTIPQQRVYLPRYQQLVLTKFVIWTPPTENVADFYVYFDHLKVLTDVFENPYDGEILASKDFVEETWKAGEGK